MSDKAPDRVDCDLLVVGSGAAGMAAAITAKLHGLSVVLVEKAEVFGGTTALSGGGLWVPGNPVSERIGLTDSRAAAREYMAVEAGEFNRPDMVEAFLEHGPAMVAFFEENTAVRFVPAPLFPDYHPGQPGASHGGRTLYAAPYDGRELGAQVKALRPPLQEMTLFGLVTVSGDEVRHFLNATRSLRSARYVAGVFLRHLRDTLRHGRGMRLTNGNALAARLARSVFDLDIPLWLNAPVQSLTQHDGRITGAKLHREGREVLVQARRGVVLACGGFPQDRARQRALFPHVQRGGAHHSPAPIGNTGDGLAFGEQAGGRVDAHMAHPAAWAVFSRVPRNDGSVGVYPHFIDRAKPGMIAVDARGQRFVNESDSYHDVIAAALRSAAPDVRGLYLLCDHRAIRQYGLGFVKPFPMPLGGNLRNGYLKRGRTLAELAAQIGVDPAALQATVDGYNAEAAHGRDPLFGKGGNAYNRFNGDPSWPGPNPCIAPMVEAPFYAVELVVGDLGTFAGLRTDAQARVLDAREQPIPGLYAAGNDMASIMGGNYPGGGITLGPAMTFGYIAGRHAASLSSSTDQQHGNL
ncbi:FAD-dependent oxidoreductase [Hydrogenophaga sp.]|uniref:FAD-dependent oxidoreductase n=1 Tax=Hydrogenophaga sp. TaxID=1904254 RepID=UPI0027272856|nr:FAD-dependent oxidoreductase [Hydrogenophaga sp.]MDO9434559.1 FAD-dependent oxidoreductase [Hydrogenophaga sp.]